MWIFTLSAELHSLEKRFYFNILHTAQTAGMKIFVNDKPVRIIQYAGPRPYPDYDTVLNGKNEIVSTMLNGRVMVENATATQLDRLLRLFEVKKLKKMKSITFSITDYDFMVQFVKDQFKIVKAAGGVVKKSDKILMIYRMKKWDLPKGKLNKKESIEDGAKREVEEECSVRVELREKICTTWHTYTRKGKRILKRTDWYEMSCLDDSNMQPQLEEFIEEVKWMTVKDVRKSLKNSYGTIYEVMETFYKGELDTVG